MPAPPQGLLPGRAALLQGEPTEHPVVGNAPESIANILGYEIAQPTPVPANYNGVYCRGGACQYRVPPPVPITFGPTPFPNMLYGLNMREFCRGLGCMPMMGWPADPAVAAFNLNCGHLFDHVAGGLKGPASHRTIMDAKDSFMDWCKQRVDVLEVGACPAYADVLVMSLSPVANAPSVGGTADICTNMHLFIGSVKMAEILLKLVPEALPKAKGSSLLALSLNRFGTGGVGPDSPRGRRWKAYAQEHFGLAAAGAAPQPSAAAGYPTQLAVGAGPLPTATLLQGDARGPGARGDDSLLQQRSAKRGQRREAQAPFDDGSEDSMDPRGLPKYNQNPPSDQGVMDIPQSATKYQIVPGSADGTVPPVEVAGDLMNYCSDQFSEIMMGFAQTGSMTVTMTKDWCRWQSSVTSWVGQKEEYGHPDWKYRDCEAMANYVAYALRDHLSSEKGLGAGNVCAALFIAQGAVHRVDQLVKDAWTVSLRKAPTLASTTALGNDEEIKKLMEKAQAYADGLYNKMRKQAEGFKELNGAKMDTAAFADQPVAPQQVAGPSLPSSSDVQPEAVSLAVVTETRLRRWGGGH